jgi:Fe2+ or Zn2+ uptake regulation protein
MGHYQPDIAQIVAKFEERGMRWTVQRQLVLQIILERAGHLTVDDVYAEVAKTFPSVNRSTIYRTMETLSEMGLLVEMHGGGNLRRYELVHANPHYHATCTKCGGEIEVANEVVDKLLADIWQQFHLQLKLEHFLGMGLCSICHQNYQHSHN